MRKDSDSFEGREMVLVYIAKKLKEALSLEAVLTEAGIDYAVETDHYTGGLIFRSQRVGAFFYVPSEAGDAVRLLMTERGYRPQDAAGL